MLGRHAETSLKHLQSVRFKIGFRTEEARFALVHAWRRCQALGRVKVWMP